MLKTLQRYEYDVTLDLIIKTEIKKNWLLVNGEIELWLSCSTSVFYIVVLFLRCPAYCLFHSTFYLFSYLI